MSKKKIFRKPSPQPPNWFWWDTDNYWDCNCDHKGCRNCKRLKEMRKIEANDKLSADEKRKRLDAMNITVLGIARKTLNK